MDRREGGRKQERGREGGKDRKEGIKMRRREGEREDTYIHRYIDTQKHRYR